MAPTSTPGWKLRHLDAWKDYTLQSLVSRTVTHLSIEFLNANETIPHVVFHVQVKPTAQDPSPKYKAVRLSMEWDGRAGSSLGTFWIKPLEYPGPSLSAHGAFSFQILKENLSVKDWCQILRGCHPNAPTEHKSDLTRGFRFVARPDEFFDGCRDFM